MNEQTDNNEDKHSSVIFEDMNDLEQSLQSLCSQFVQFCSSIEKQIKNLRESYTASDNMVSQFKQCSSTLDPNYPEIGMWFLTIANYTNDANELQNEMITNWKENFILPLNRFLKETSKKIKTMSKQHTKAVNAYEIAESKVKLCREKGKQTNMIKLLELEKERNICHNDSELQTINKTSVLKKAGTNVQLKLYEGIHFYLESYINYFTNGYNMFEAIRKKLPKLQNIIDNKKEALTQDVVKYVTATSEQLNLNIASDLSLSTVDRLNSPLVITNRELNPPLMSLPKQIQEYYNTPNKYAISTTGKLKGSTKEAMINLANYPSELIVSDINQQTSTSKNINEILQVTRSRFTPKVKIQYKQREKSKLLFTDLEQKERFYEELSFTMNHSNQTLDLTEDIKIWIGSWNMGDAPPPSDIEELSKWIPRENFDLYVIGSQECEYKPKGIDDTENPTSCEGDWFGRIQNFLGTDFIRVCGLSLMSIRLLVIVRRSLWFKISNVKKGTEACGIANIVGNKGAVGISFNFNETRLIFINSHLAAHQKNLEDRHQNYRQIVANLKLISQNQCYLTNYFHYVFWLGDLNYRLDDDRDNVITKIKNQKYKDLYLSDQLTRERVWGNTFAGFSEGNLNFPPTYRYCRGSNEYSEEKLRIPSWCDRILWKALPNCDVTLHNYTSCDEIFTSDHHPISGEFTLTTRKPNWPHIPNKNCRIHFYNLEATGLETKDNLPIDASLVFICDSFPQNIISPIAYKSINPRWDTLLPISVLTTNKEYLIGEHIFIIIREHGKKKEIIEHGQSVISLKNACGDEPIHFDCKLQNRGKFQGNLKGKVHVTWDSNHENIFNIDMITKKKGYLLKHKRRKWERLWFVLTSDCIYFYQTESAEKLNGKILVTNALINDLGNEKYYSFSIENNKKTIELRATSIEEKTEWINQLNIVSKQEQIIIKTTSNENITIDNNWERKSPISKNQEDIKRLSSPSFNKRSSWSAIQASPGTRKSLLGSRQSITSSLSDISKLTSNEYSNLSNNEDSENSN